VLVEMDNVVVANADAPGDDCAGGHGSWTVKVADGTDQMYVSDMFRARYTYTPVVGNTFNKIIGVLEYSYAQFVVEPRGCDDLIGSDGSTVCPPCPPPGTVVTVAQIQNPNAEGHVNVGCDVQLEGVVATTGLVPKASGNPSRSSFYVSDPAGGEWSGIYIYNSQQDASAVAAGKLVTVRGTVTEYWELTELTASAITVTGDGVLPAPVVVTATQINTDSATHENYEGVYVRIDNVQITDAVFPGTDGLDHGDFQVAPASSLTDKLVVGWQFKYPFSCPPTAGTPCPTDQRVVGVGFISITGVMDWSFSNARIQPRSDADLALVP
jgi:hypothetical protein